MARSAFDGVLFNLHNASGLFANLSDLGFAQQRKEQAAQASIDETAWWRNDALAREDGPAPNGASRTRVNILGGTAPGAVRHRRRELFSMRVLASAAQHATPALNWHLAMPSSSRKRTELITSKTLRNLVN